MTFVHIRENREKGLTRILMDVWIIVAELRPSCSTDFASNEPESLENFATPLRRSMGKLYWCR
ncbi:MAG TPA: hypothetical protein VGY77_02755 [Gemmataceae bacterium]|jgi:hypothetical protein|nr:hypothetical protein [Gemmataceae bacterium]